MEPAVELYGADRSVALVLGVARLGETNLRAWWRCHALDPQRMQGNKQPPATHPK